MADISPIIGLIALGSLVHEPDKLNHAAAGALVSTYVAEVTGEPWKGCVAGLALGLAKEAYDATGHGHVEARDALATAAPGCTFVWRW